MHTQASFHEVPMKGHMKRLAGGQSRQILCPESLHRNEDPPQEPRPPQSGREFLCLQPWFHCYSTLPTKLPGRT